MKPHFLRTERKRRGWSQMQLAEALEVVSIAKVRRWERGRVIFSLHRRKMSALFFMPLEQRVDELRVEGHQHASDKS